MLITSQLSSSEQWQQKQQIINSLYKQARASIFDDPVEKDRLKEDLLSFVYSNYFDQSQGGYISQCDSRDQNSRSNLFFKPIITNIYLCEILSASSPVLCDGELSHFQQQIFEYLINRIETDTLRDSQCLPIERLSSFYSLEAIESLLSEKEKELLCALTNSNNLCQDGILFSYTKSLKVAAKEINMEVKEAQILEYSLKSKLKSLSANDEETYSSQIKRADSIVLEAIISLMSYYNPKNKSKLLSIVKPIHVMTRNREAIRTYSDEQLINYICALIYFLQLEFDLQVLTLIRKCIDLLNKRDIKEVDKRENYRLELIRQFCIAIERQGLISFSKGGGLDGESSLTDLTYELVFLEKNQPTNEHLLVKFQSEFNPYRLVFLH